MNTDNVQNDSVPDDMMNKQKEMVFTELDTTMQDPASPLEKEINHPSTETPLNKKHDLPERDHGDAIEMDEYVIQVWDDLEYMAKTGTIDRNDKNIIYYNYLEHSHTIERPQPNLQNSDDNRVEKIQHKFVKADDDFDRPSFDLKISQDSEPNLDTNDEKDGDKLQSNLTKEDKHYDGASSDLKVSQEFGNIILQKFGDKAVDKEGKPVKFYPVNPNNEVHENVKEETPMVKRLRNPSVYANSPYYMKTVEVLDMVKPIELTISNRLYALDGEIE